MIRSPSESQQTQTFSIDHENVLPEHYRLIELIGRGGMAEVYLAEDRRLGRKVAIKFLNPEFRRDPDRVRRFRQEARSASALNHPNILIIHDIGDRGGVQFIVSEFVEGETLGTRIAQGRIPFADAVDIAIQAASALTAAHSAGIVHRDIKPDNVMIRNDGVVKVLDFGLAKARGFTTLNGGDFDAMTLDSGSTSPGLIVGTPQYMSPEQARGKELDGRTDIFSLGIIIFEMVTRHSPFAGGSFADTMAAILTKEPRRMDEFVDDAPTRLIDLVGKCLKKDRNERFSSIAEVETELKLLRTELIAHPRDTAEVNPAKSDRTQIRPTHQHSIRKYISSTFQKPSPMAAAIILVAGVLLVGGWWAWDRVSLRSTAPSLMRTVPITSWSSNTSESTSAASFSPDGKMIAFAVRRDDVTDLWVKPVLGGDPVQVTRNSGHNNFPVWSGDGQQIAFLSSRGGNMGIWRIPFTGGDAALVLGNLDPNTKPFYWDSDGSIYLEAKREIVRVVEGHEPEAMTQFGQAGLVPGTVRMSDDRRSVVYTLRVDEQWRMIVRSLANGQEMVVATSNDQIDYIAWSPDGRSICFSATDEGLLQVYEAAVDGSGVIQRSNGESNYIVHDVSSSGAILYGSVSETSDLWRLDLRTGIESVVANEVALEYWPDVAPDASIVFQEVSRVERPQRGSIKVVDAHGGTTTVSPSGFIPVWSKSGNWIAYFRRNDPGIEVWKANRDASQAMRISNANASGPSNMFAPYLRLDSAAIAWSPDERHVIFSTLREGGVRLWLSSTDGTLTGRLLTRENPEDEIEREPIWTPDGHSVVFRTGHVDRQRAINIYRVRVANVNSGRQRAIFESIGGPLRVLGVTENGKDVIVSRRSEFNPSPVSVLTEIHSINLESGISRKLKTINNAFFANMVLSEKGDVIVFARRDGEVTAITMIDLNSGSGRDLLRFNDPKILVSSIAIARNDSFITFGKQTRTSLISMLVR